MKTCYKCKQVKDDSEFYKSNNMRHKDGLDGMCKICHLEYNHQHPWNVEKKKITNSIWKKENYRRVWAINTRGRHKSSGYNVIVSLDYLHRLAEKTDNCSICGVPLDWSTGSKGKGGKDNSPSLDRINNENILSENNVCIVCNKCNTRKHNDTFENFITFCKSVIENEDSIRRRVYGSNE